MQLSLGQRIFLAFSGLLVLILGLAAGITYYRGNAIAERAVVDALEKIRTVQSGFESQRFHQLGMISEIFASDPYFSSYVAEATGGNLGLGGQVDTGSIMDLLAERQQNLGFDFAMVLNSAGKVIARTDDQSVVDEDLSADVVVGPAIKSLESATGYWFRDAGAFQIAVVPLADEQDLVGFLLTGLVVDGKFADEIKNISGSELVFLRDNKNNLEAVTGTLDSGELQALIASRELIKSALDGEPVKIDLAGKNWLASVARAGSPQTGGISVALTSLDEALADFRAIENVLIIVTGISIMLALPISLAISRRVLAPVRRLAGAAQAAARGNYLQTFTTEGKDEVASLTMAFDTLLSDLREKSDMQGYMADLAKYLPDAIESKPASGAPKNAARQVSKYGAFSLLGIDLRRFIKRSDQITPEETFNLLNANLQNIDLLARGCSGRVIGMTGHRVLVVFEGQEGYKRALAVAGSILANLMSNGEGIAAAIVQGDATLGAAQIGEVSVENLLGLTVYHLERLLLEASSGQIFLARNVHDAIKKELPDFISQVGLGLVSKSKFYALVAANANVFGIDGADVTLQVPQEITRDSATKAKRIHIVPGMSLGGRYEIISELGAGGMGIVYKAHDHELDDLVALKMLKISDVEGAGEFLDAMKSEIRLARKITHPAVLRTYDYGELEGVPYISMEYVRGLTLKYLLNQSGKIPYSAGLQIAKQLAAGLQAAHAQGILHRDIKPENVILELNGNAKLMDFGIARKVTGPGLGDMEGAVVGTPRYAAPEQLVGKPVDVRADIYAAGVLMYQMYTGEFPFTAKKLEQLIKAKTTEDPTKPSVYWKEIPLDLEELIMKCIAREPGDRLENADTLLQELEKLRA